MTNHEAAAPGQKPLSTVRRKAIGSTPLSLVRLSSLPADANLPLLIEPALRGVDLIRWAAGNKEFIETRLLTHGALLFRNFNVDGAAEFEQFITAVSGAP